MLHKIALSELLNPIVQFDMFPFSWGAYCMSVVILALNRCIEIHSVEAADRLFAGKKAFLWMIPPWIYALIFASTIDLPPIYNTEWSVYFFKIDFRDGAPLVTDWICFGNSVWVISTLLVLYSILMYRLKRNSEKYQANSRKSSKMQKHNLSIHTVIISCWPSCIPPQSLWWFLVHRASECCITVISFIHPEYEFRFFMIRVMLQSFLICFFLFLVAILYALPGFIRIPNRFTKFATISVQICSGFTSIVYLVINKEIKKGVKKMFLGNSAVSSVLKSSTFKNENTVKNSAFYKDQHLSDDHKYA